VASPVSTGGGAAAPAPPAVPIHWPAAMGTRFIVMVDTEEEFDWSAPFNRAAQATTAIGAIPETHRRFAAAGVPVTYLVDYPVVTDPVAVDVLRATLADGRSSIGAQLHPWVTPPHDEDPSVFNSFPGNLPQALEAAKIDRLTAAISDAFGSRPIAYRAGRYGRGPHTLDLLARFGYRIDASVRAFHDYRAQGGPDYSQADAGARRVGRAGDIIELPFTTIWTGWLRRSGPAVYRLAGRVPRGYGLLAQARLLSRVSLTPEGVRVGEALEAIRVALGEGLPLFSLSFHSPSLVPGHTPYVRDARDLAVFHRWWDAVLALFDQRGVRPIGLNELLAAADSAR